MNLIWFYSKIKLTLIPILLKPKTELTMAKLGDNILSAGSGSLGNMVMYSMHGKNYVRLKPSKYNDRKSEAQLSQRAKMQLVTEFMKPFKELIRKTYAAEATGRAPYHAAKSYLMRNAVDGTYPDFTINKSNALLSKGPLPVPPEARFQIQNDQLLIEWNESTENDKAYSRDTLIVVAFNPQNGRSDYRFTNTLRKENHFSWKPEISLSNDLMPDVWIAFRSFDEELMSNSIYITV